MSTPIADPPQSLLGPTLEHAVVNTRDMVMRQSPVVRWMGLAIVIALGVWMFTGPSDSGTRQVQGVSVPLDGPTLTREQALAVIRETRETALVESQADEVFVSYSAKTFPLDAPGQLNLVRRFVRADEVVEGRKRRIFFHNPNGRLFAQSDGVTGLQTVGGRR